MITIDTIKVKLPLKKKFAISGGEATNKINLVTVMNNRYSGEASGSVAYGPSVETIEAELSRGIQKLATHHDISLDTLEAISRFDIHPVARSALSAMILNYLSGEAKRYPWEILSIGRPVGIKSSITISVGETEEIIAAIKEAAHPIVKVKLGNDNDLELIEALKEINDKVIRVDANGAWSLEKAQEMLYYLARSGITVVEQPTSIEDIKRWPELKGSFKGMELFVDEGLNSLEDYEQVSEFVDGINIKMEKSGGIIEASRIARKAREDNKKVMLGCMVESSVGIAQSIYMSSLADYHDLDGPQLLVDDIASGITYTNEKIEVDREIIGGPKLKREVVNRYISE